MFQPWRLKLRAADEALKNGRLDDASRLLRESDVRDFLPARQLLTKVADRMVERARQRVDGGQSAAGWRDLETARTLGADAEAVTRLRQDFIDRRLAEAVSYLAAGEPAAALTRLDELARHDAGCRQARLLRQAAGKCLDANRLCRRGEFAAAHDELSAALTLAPEVKTLDDARKACSVKATECRRLTERLHAALAAADWTLALAEAEALLELCPEHEPARDARRRAWAAVGMSVPGLPRAAPIRTAAGKIHQELGHPRANAIDTPRSAGTPLVNGVPKHGGGLSRFLLWVDGVGGYLVCSSNEVTLGQPVPGSQVDVPILGDISRRHAKIRRDGENYLIDPIRPVRLNGRDLDRVATLSDGSMLELGPNVRLRFRRPHALSATARLEFVSHHRTQPSADAVLLMADSLVLGPSAACHVQCRDWAQDVVLFRQEGGLHCRTSGRFEIDGASQLDRGPLGVRSQVAGPDFSLSIEGITG